MCITNELRKKNGNKEGKSTLQHTSIPSITLSLYVLVNVRRMIIAPKENRNIKFFLKLIKVFTFNIYAISHKYNFTFVKISERGDLMKKDFERFFPTDLTSNIPLIEMTGNREITIEGCTGVLKYESENIKVNTKSMVISVTGRSLKLKYLSSSALVIEGTVLKIEFIL